LVNGDTYIADMAKEAASTPSDRIAETIRGLMEDRGWSVAELARRCGEAGLHRFTAQVLYKLLSQRTAPGRVPRPITVDELLILAYVLDIAPVHLIAGLDDDTPLPVSPGWTVSAAGARQWIRGLAAVAGGDKKRYLANVPSSEENARWFVVRDVTSYEQVLSALEGLKQYVSLQKQLSEEGGS
jgi:transcriptional regulator with XRE-family HTH domain